MRIFRSLAVSLIVFATSSCFGPGFDTRSYSEREGGGASEPENIGSLAAYYGGNSDWNQYVRNNGTDYFDADNTPCDGTETGTINHSYCIHGATRWWVELPGVTDCSGLSFGDALNVFEWECVPGNPVVIRSIGIRAGKGLGDLIEGTSWRDNRLEISQSGNLSWVTNSEPWHSNTIVELPDNSGGATLVLDGVDDDGAGADAAFTSGTIFVLSADAETPGYNVALDNVAIVTLNGATLSYDGAGSFNCNTADGTTATADAICLISVASRDFVWIEGNYDGIGATNAEKLLFLFGTKFNQVRRVKTAVSDTSSSEARCLELKDGGAAEDSAFNLVSEFRATQCYYGINMESSTRNVFHEINVSGNRHHGIQGTSGSLQSESVFVKVMSANNGSPVVGHGISVVQTTHNTYSHVTTARNVETGIYVNNAENTFNNVLAFNNSDSNIEIRYGNNTQFANIATAHSDVAGINYTADFDTTGIEYHGVVLAGNNTGGNCVIDAGDTDPGIDGSCGPVGVSSDHSGITGTNMSSAFPGKVSSDSDNTSESGGTAPYTAALDWFGFENFFRFWGTDVAGIPDSTAQEYCDSGTCAIFDLRLDAGDSVVRDTSGAGSSANDSFVSGGACPAAVDGNNAITDRKGDTFLINALEVVNDSTGNNDGLCESDEACIYSPNFGAYQGEGDYRSRTCVFQDGTVSGVTMYGYPVNGA